MSWLEHRLTFRHPETASAFQSGRVIGRTQCGACDWSAELTGDTNLEVEQFLVRLLTLHVIDHHPEG